jgi:hypothetical protein
MRVTVCPASEARRAPQECVRFQPPMGSTRSALMSTLPCSQRNQLFRQPGHGHPSLLPCLHFAQHDLPHPQLIVSGDDGVGDAELVGPLELAGQLARTVAELGDHAGPTAARATGMSCCRRGHPGE